MQKLLLTSIVAATILVPAVAARKRSARRGLRLALTWTILFNLAYVIALMFIYPRL